MDTFELNKIAGAVLFALLIIFGTRSATTILFKPHHPEKPGYEVEVADTQDAGGAGGAAEEDKVPLANLLAEADAAKGERVAKKCLQCHTFEKGGANKIGPNLWGVLGSDIASREGFAYSGALKEKDGAWDYEAVSHFVTKPQGFAPGTKMAFPGIKKADQRADLLMYMRTQADSPPPLPEPVAQAAPEAPEAQTPQEPAEPAQPPAEAQPMQEQPQQEQQPAETPAQPQQPQ